jgi:hypothetical protein
MGHAVDLAIWDASLLALGGVRRSRNLNESSKTLKCDRAASISKMRRRLSFDGSGQVNTADLGGERVRPPE